MLIEKCYSKDEYYYEVSILLEINSKLSEEEQKDINLRLDKVFASTYFGCDIANMVLAIRTILTGFKIRISDYELMLDFATEYENITVAYSGCHLDLYTKTLDVDGILFNINFANGNMETRFKLPFGCTKEQASDMVSCVNTTEKRNIRKLHKITNKSLSCSDIALIETYKMFYEENPDFTDSKICAKANFMLYLLSENGLIIAPEKNEIPYTMVANPIIKGWFNELKSFAGVYRYDKNKSQIDDKIGIKIKEVADIVNSTLKDYYWLDEIDVLTHFCEVYEIQKTALSDKELTDELVRELNKK